MKDVFNITKDILSDIQSISLEHDFYSLLMGYCYDRDEDFSCTWPSLTHPVENNKKIIYHLGELAENISQTTTLDWMTFIIQSPYISAPRILPLFRYHNFGIKASERLDWNSWIEADETFTFTKLFFGENLTPETYSKIFCVRIQRLSERCMTYASEYDLIFINVTVADEKQSATIDSIEFSDARVSWGLKHHLETMKQYYKEKGKKYSLLLYEYIKKMGHFTKLGDNFNYLYGIPVLSLFLPRTSPTRSGIYLPSQDEINPVTLRGVQTIISESLCHVDYIRFAAKAEKEQEHRLQREKEITHLLYEFPHIVGNYVSKDIERALDFGAIETAKRLAVFMKAMGTYMSSTLNAKEPRKVMYKVKECIEGLKNTPLRLTIDLPIENKVAFEEELRKWESMIGDCEIEDSLAIDVPEGVLEIIFSNLLSNSRKYNADPPQVSIAAKISDNKCVITYRELQGKGFEPTTIKNIKRWAIKGPKEEEGYKGFGYRSIYKAVEIANGEMGIVIPINGQEKDILTMEDQLLDDLINNPAAIDLTQLYHRFIFNIRSADAKRDHMKRKVFKKLFGESHKLCDKEGS